MKSWGVWGSLSGSGVFVFGSVSEFFVLADYLVFDVAATVDGSGWLLLIELVVDLPQSPTSAIDIVHGISRMGE